MAYKRAEHLDRKGRKYISFPESKRKTKFVDSGCVIFSKYPIVSSLCDEFEAFGSGIDGNVCKGVVYACLDISGDNMISKESLSEVKLDDLAASCRGISSRDLGDTSVESSTVVVDASPDEAMSQERSVPKKMHPDSQLHTHRLSTRGGSSPCKQYVHIFNTHLQASYRTDPASTIPTGSGLNKDARYKQLREMCGFISECVKSHPFSPIFVCGDFNINTLEFDMNRIILSEIVKDRLYELKCSHPRTSIYVPYTDCKHILFNTFSTSSDPSQSVPYCDQKQCSALGSEVCSQESSNPSVPCVPQGYDRGIEEDELPPPAKMHEMKIEEKSETVAPLLEQGSIEADKSRIDKYKYQAEPLPCVHSSGPTHSKLVTSSVSLLSSKITSPFEESIREGIGHVHGIDIHPDMIDEDVILRESISPLFGFFPPLSMSYLMSFHSSDKSGVSSKISSMVDVTKKLYSLSAVHPFSLAVSSALLYSSCVSAKSDVPANMWKEIPSLFPPSIGISEDNEEYNGFKFVLSHIPIHNNRKPFMKFYKHSTNPSFISSIVHPHPHCVTAPLPASVSGSSASSTSSSSSNITSSPTSVHPSSFFCSKTRWMIEVSDGVYEPSASYPIEISSSYTAHDLLYEAYHAHPVTFGDIFLTHPDVLNDICHTSSVTAQIIPCEPCQDHDHKSSSSPTSLSQSSIRQYIHSTRHSSKQEKKSMMCQASLVKKSLSTSIWMPYLNRACSMCNCVAVPRDVCLYGNEDAMTMQRLDYVWLLEPFKRRRNICECVGGNVISSIDSDSRKEKGIEAPLHSLKDHCHAFGDSKSLFYLHDGKSTLSKVDEFLDKSPEHVLSVVSVKCQVIPFIIPYSGDYITRQGSDHNAVEITVSYRWSKFY
ncbi:hypothetical protein ADUPG1_011466 [Aduncisulcus paluster]|uniref:Sphingomyelin phosphodiesterase n=1 Tax=Aduncisulcus paluster TaxID=2918883 RepID=A0ABQ5JVS7_9EUKA|nr:hypothetical protein ADUPG1_011466 [Aduncisulcus paluster]